jgi:hypothetical protein
MPATGSMAIASRIVGRVECDQLVFAAERQEILKSGLADL